ncbi:M23 family metallopeptidase [bacterium]|nr:M23 family metallopeptidase [bacterium]
MSFALTGDRNWFNIIYPNDYVNVYVDRADNQGWTRLFFGFIDHIEQIISIEEHHPSTVYSIQCSDFQKALERTQIYFNPHVAAREDFSGGFVGTPNIGGLALMTRGIRMNGSPADLALNVMLLLLGFGGQFVLPTSYNPRLASRLRQQRADFILGRLSADARRQVLDAGGYAGFLEQVRNQLNIETSTQELIDPDSTNPTQVQRAERRRFSQQVQATLGGGTGATTETSQGASERGAEAFNVLNTTVPGYPPTLLDIVDIFTFVERTAIDGYVIGAPMWENQGNILSFLRSISNEVVNELFFDLRPMNRGGGLSNDDTFSREPDDLEGNLPGQGTVAAGIQYVPAMIMREYPFSTIQGIDGDGIQLSIRQQSAPGGTTVTQNETLGRLHFGAIFSNSPNAPGRHVIRIPNINAEDNALGRSTEMASKHLDVVVIRDKELISTRFSRSDTDHFNLFEFYSDALIGQDARFFMQDLLPIITPVNIVRHGLRVRSLTTRFGRFSLDVVQRTQPPPTQEQVEESEEAADEPAPTPAPATPEVVLPVDLVAPAPGFRGQGYVSRGNGWNYRRKTFNGTRPFNNVRGNTVPPAGTAYWRFHNGVDIVGPRGVPVRAVRSGQVVMAAPVDTAGRAGYGNIVMIYHPDVDMYSLYAHLDSIAENLQVSSRGRNLLSYVSSSIRPRGRYRPVEVRAGDVIGTMGNTDCETGRDRQGGVHLHFELLVKRGNLLYPSSLDRTALTPDVFLTSPPAVPGALVSGSIPTNPDESQTISQDPVRIFTEWGVPMPVGPSEVEGLIAPDEPVPPDGTYPGDAGEDFTDEDNPAQPVPNDEVEEQDDPQRGASTQINVGSVDTPTTRRQLARWALLNDHWYQHNLEYLSGTIDMRGAPEIRVGYRVDLADRALSFYVEGVSHSWSYGQNFRTTLHVTRGSRTILIQATCFLLYQDLRHRRRRDKQLQDLVDTLLSQILLLFDVRQYFKTE